MSVTRRQFLLSTAGASIGAIVPDFYFRALQFFEQFGEPLLELPNTPTMELFAYSIFDECELSLGHPEEEPPKLTFREFFTRYEPWMLETFEEDWGRELADLDELMDEGYLWDHWFLKSGPSARAHSHLQNLDLGPVLSDPNAVGGLEFFEDSNIVSYWRGVRYEDEVTLSLLQWRLNDLGAGIRIVPALAY